MTFTVQSITPGAGYQAGWTEVVIVDGGGMRRSYSYYTERPDAESIARRLRADLDREEADARQKALVGRTFSVPRHEESAGYGDY